LIKCLAMLVQEKEWYRDWFNSPYYHLLYEERDTHEAAAFINLLVDHLNPKPGSYMLDIACGKGRHSFQLAEKGYQVTGIDISPKSILEAQRTGNDNPEFFIHDMRLPFRINYYDYAFNFFTSFGYFDTKREHYNAIHNMTASLKKGGVFVMDYLNPEYILQHLEPRSEIKKCDILFSVERYADTEYFFKKITVQDPSLKEPGLFMEKVARFDLNHFNEMFKANGLGIQEVFGDYQLSGYLPYVSPRMIMIAKKE
jgi:SAM-dependent methyltransferase